MKHTVRNSYRLEHRRPGETDWLRNTPATRANWSWQSRKTADRCLSDARERWPDHDFRLVLILTTVDESIVLEGNPS